jgi:hypothetical protein
MGFGLYLWISVEMVSIGFSFCMAAVGMLELYFYIGLLLADE